MATQTSDTNPALMEYANFTALMQAITGCQITLTSKTDSLQLEMCLMRKDYDKICGQMDEAERRVGATEDSVRDHSAALHSIQVRLKHLKSRVEDAENRNQCNNLRIIGLLEGVEGNDTPAYTEHLLRMLFLQAAF